MVLEIGGSAPLIRQAATTQQPLPNLIGRQERYRTSKKFFLFLQKKEGKTSYRDRILCMRQAHRHLKDLIS